MRTESIQLVEWFMEALCRHGASQHGDAVEVAAESTLEASHGTPRTLSDLLGGEVELAASLLAHYKQAGREDLGEVVETVTRAAVAAARLPSRPEAPARLSGLVYPVL